VQKNSRFTFARHKIAEQGVPWQRQRTVAPPVLPILDLTSLLTLPLSPHSPCAHPPVTHPYLPASRAPAIGALPVRAQLPYLGVYVEVDIDVVPEVQGRR
jgi:hypothetical protein